MVDAKVSEIQEERREHSAILRILAWIVSYAFHPVFMPTVMTIALYKLAPASFAGINTANFGKILLPIIINTLFFPLVATMLIKATGFIESIHMKTSKDRIIPLLASMIFYFWAYNVFKNIAAPHILKVLLLGCFWGVIAVFMVNIFMKISMHTAAAGSMIGILLVLMFTSSMNMVLPFFAALVIAGLIGTARMILGAHYKAEIWLGYIIGILVQVAAYLYL
jgi:hypothetical protein